MFYLCYNNIIIIVFLLLFVPKEWKGVTSLEQQEELPHNGRSEPPQNQETPGPPAHLPQVW